MDGGLAEVRGRGEGQEQVGGNLEHKGKRGQPLNPIDYLTRRAGK